MPYFIVSRLQEQITKENEEGKNANITIIFMTKNKIIKINS